MSFIEYFSSFWYLFITFTIMFLCLSEGEMFLVQILFIVPTEILSA